MRGRWFLTPFPHLRHTAKRIELAEVNYRPGRLTDAWPRTLSRCRAVAQVRHRKPSPRTRAWRPAEPWFPSPPGDLRITRLVLAICPVTAIPGSEPSQSCLTLTADAQVFLQAARLDDNRRCATYSTQVRQRARTAASNDARQHTQLAGTTANRPAAPLVRDEKAWTMRTKRGPAPIDSRSVQLDLLTTCSLWSREPTGTRGLAWNAAS